MPYHDRRVPGASHGGPRTGRLCRWAVAVAVPALLVGCRPAVRPAAETAARGQAFLEVEGTRIVGTDSRGRVRWELRAASVVVDREQRVTAHQAAGYLTAEDGTRVRIQGQQARYLRLEGRVELTGQVRVVADENRWMVADRAWYEPARDLLVATGNVRLRVEGWTASAQQLASEPALRRVRLLDSVRLSVEASP